MLERHLLSSIRLSVRPSQAGIVSKRLDKSSWVLVWRLSPRYPTGNLGILLVFFICVVCQGSSTFQPQAYVGLLFYTHSSTLSVGPFLTKYNAKEQYGQIGVISMSRSVIFT